MEYIEGGIRLLEETYYSFCSVGCRRLKGKNYIIGRVGVKTGSPVFYFYRTLALKRRSPPPHRSGRAYLVG